MIESESYLETIKSQEYVNGQITPNGGEGDNEELHNERGSYLGYHKINFTISWL